MDDDDDAPPSLSTLQDQIQALGHQSSAPKPAANGEGDDNLPTAVTTILGAKSQEPPKPTAVLKRGFFDAKPKPAAKPQPKAVEAAESMPHLKGRKDDIGRPSIPEFLRVEPDEQSKRLDAIKGKLVTALQPTPDTVSKLSANPDLMAGFNDPEVMAAVEEMTKDPAKAQTKYKNNKKVQAFYSAMALFAGNQLEKLGTEPV